MKRAVRLLLIAIVGVAIVSCDFLDVVPDNVATIDQAFDRRDTAERFLFTLYSYMPQHGSLSGNPAFTAGDSYWLPPESRNNGWQIARDNQRVVNPFMNFWEGKEGGTDLYEGIRQTNIFLENIDRVPNMPEAEKLRWSAEAKFLKAYYHFYLLRMYGPIVTVRENTPVDAGPDAVDKPRAPVDSTVNYIVQLLDEAAQDLPDRIQNETTELGRASKVIAKSLKAKVLVTAASPLFNGNQDYQGFTGPDGTQLIDTEQDPSKWDRAAQATQEAVDLAESLGYELYRFNPNFQQFNLSDTTITKMSIRNSMAKKWNSEIIWGNTNSLADFLQNQATPRGLDPEHRVTNQQTRGVLGPPLRIAEMYYTKNGVPISQSTEWEYSERYEVKRVTSADDRYNMIRGYDTAKLHFDREYRFYAHLAFDGGIWYGQGRLDDDSGNLFWVESREGGSTAMINPSLFTYTGYWPKKIVNYQNIIQRSSYNVQQYPWPVLRLADLYLLHAEAVNEAEGPTSEVYEYVNRVRERAGIPTVQESWSNYSTEPDKYTTEAGMRDIIHRERLIELAFEGHRFWDLRRWKEAINRMNQPIRGWDLFQEDAEAYYRPRLVYDLSFSTRDYLWPISENEVLSNSELIQNPGW